MLRSAGHILAVLSVAACTKLEGPVAPQQETLAVALAAAGLQSRPWASACEGTGTFTGPTTLRITGVCNITHLGRSTLEATESVVPGPNGTSVLNAVNTYTAANGDILYTTSTGVATLTPDFSGVTFTGIETAVAGTGRFTNATGSATRIGSTRFSDLRGSYRNAGELTYAASDGGQ